MRALLIVNPHATTTTARARDVLVSALGDVIKVDVALTESRHHASAIAAQAVDDGREAVIAFGGDGTINEIVNGLLDDRDAPAADLPVLGVVPGGSSNVFARALGFPDDPVEATGALLESLRGDVTRSIGLGRADARWFTFTAGLGLDAGAVERVERARGKGRTVTDGLYVRAAVSQYLFATRHREQPVTATLPDGEVLHLAHAMVTNTSPWTYLGRREVVVTPNTTFETGLGLFGLAKLPMLGTLRAVAQLLREQAPHTKHATIREDLTEVALQAEGALPFEVDGDFVDRRSTVTLRSHPDALRVFAPVPTD
ncbi:MAG TPA: diacylglycerol kinase family protein [Mycobacteriales bacterium]|nr:diacylglycerol kinase family protein [Mycobacteriales bacterium]